MVDVGMVAYQTMTLQCRRLIVQSLVVREDKIITTSIT